MINVLLITHNTADNLGDLVIESTAKALVGTALRNIGFADNEYNIDSVEPGMVNDRYFSMHQENHTQIFENKVSNSDLIVFGGAPVFNYKYEGFSERSAKILRLAEKYNKPVIFSAIGVEDYEENNPKCINLRNAIFNAPVKMITTRDNYDALSRLLAGSDIVSSRVSDPAVFTKHVFKNFLVDNEKNTTKKIGIFIIRGRAFADNRIPFNEKDAIQMWADIVSEMKKDDKYDYEILTSGSHVDEAFLHRLQIELGFPLNKCVLNMNTPEDLVKKISSYSGVITCRLHPSIISYSLGVPCIGLIWNDKVADFYKSIGYPERALSVNDFNAKKIISSVKNAIEKGVEVNHDYQMSIYEYLFNAIKGIFGKEGQNIGRYSYDELEKNIRTCESSDYDLRINWKLSRTYRDMNNYINISRRLTNEKNQLKKQYDSLIQQMQCNFTVSYNSGFVSDVEHCLGITSNSNYKLIVQTSDGVECIPVNELISNNGSYVVADNFFVRQGFKFKGWEVHVYTTDNTHLVVGSSDAINPVEKVDNRKIISVGDKLPVLKITNLKSVKFVANWTAEK